MEACQSFPMESPFWLCFEEEFSMFVFHFLSRGARRSRYAYCYLALSALLASLLQGTFLMASGDPAHIADGPGSEEPGCGVRRIPVPVSGTV